ncbi:uncharacterized protein LOC131193935 isoform X3 [Ahaetulla prasina]|uniref:uncharacterized protein LOC131193935 isoform X3 n=1 Tax=Ahaetulla prasina TaxID=499056 RepID=UPI002648423B|nr:uncharacterized protein LOC131193935 isoform X3 [Ahaetulla prasina]
MFQFFWISPPLHQVLQSSLEGVKEEGEPPTMKTYLVILGLLFLLKNEVSPLICFMCENQPTNLQCLHFGECSKEEVFCVTAVASYEFEGAHLRFKAEEPVLSEDVSVVMWPA